MITFTKARLPNGWYGNMSPHPVTYEGIEWRTTEALFQAMRFTDAEIREKIRAEKSPMSAKMVAKANKEKMTVVPGSEQDLQNMEACLRLKLKFHPDLKVELLASGDEQIVEDVTKRGINDRNLFWGMALKDGVWIGTNTLGKMWDKIRTEIREDERRALQKANSTSSDSNPAGQRAS